MNIELKQKIQQQIQDLILYAKEENWKKVLELSKLILKVDESNTIALCNIANAYYEINKYKLALKYAELALAGDPLCAEAHIIVAKYHFYRSKDLELGIYYCNKAIEINQDNPEYYSALGRGYFKFKRYEAAKENYDKALSLDSANYVYYRSLGMLFGKTKKYDMSFDYLTKALSINPNDISSLIARAYIYYIKNNFSDALVEFYKAMVINPKNQTANYYVIQCMKKNAHYQKLIAYFDSAIESNPENLILLVCRGNFYMQAKKHDNALNDLHLALKLGFEDKIPINRGIGYCYYEQGKYREAIFVFNKLLELSPTDYFYLARRGYCYLKIKKYDKALIDFHKAIELGSKEKDWIYANIGFCLSKHGDYPTAIFYFSKAIEITPNYKWAYKKRGYCYQQLSMNDKALDDFKKVEELK